MASPFHFNTHELPRRAGEMKEYSFTIIAPENIGVPLIFLPQGDEISIDLRIESVDEGVLATIEIYAVAKGECIRCLDPVEVEIDKTLRELYRYEPTDSRGARTGKRGNRKRNEEEDIDLEIDDQLWMDGNVMDLETPIRDAIVLDLPINPLCDEECQGLCPECGEKWSLLAQDHRHEVIDARWAGLSGLDFKKSDE